MVHPPRPGAQCRHHTPEGLSSSSTCASLQHSEQSPQRRSDMLSGIFVSLLMTRLLYHMMHGAVTAQILPCRKLFADLETCCIRASYFVSGCALHIVEHQAYNDEIQSRCLTGLSRPVEFQ